MDKITLVITFIGIFMIIYGIYVYNTPSRYQTKGLICEKNTMAVCDSIKQDYQTYGTAFIILGILLVGFSIFELSRKKEKHKLLKLFTDQLNNSSLTQERTTNSLGSSSSSVSIEVSKLSSDGSGFKFL